MSADERIKKLRRMAEREVKATLNPWELEIFAAGLRIGLQEQKAGRAYTLTEKGRAALALTEKEPAPVRTRLLRIKSRECAHGALDCAICDWREGFSKEVFSYFPEAKP